MAMSRVGSSLRAARDQVRPAGIMASSMGSATVAPTPRRKVRRGMCFPVMKCIDVSTGMAFQFPWLSATAGSGPLIWKASLSMTPRMNAEMR